MVKYPSKDQFRINVFCSNCFSISDLFFSKKTEINSKVLRDETCSVCDVIGELQKVLWNGHEWLIENKKGIWDKLVGN